MIKELHGIEQMSPFAPTTQVYKATHDRKDNRLSFRERSFISFSFGGRLIEDFGLIAVTDGDRLQRNTYANFDDITETYDVQNGRTYWGTHLTNNELSLTLSTDGITARQLDDFRQWFAPGKMRELILMEHPNRAIMARVSNPPQISMLPFSTTDKLKIIDNTYLTDVTLFKGDIKINFVMDEPFWYAKYNLLTPIIIGGGANGILNIKSDPHRLQNYLEKNFKNKNIYIEHRNEKGIIVQTLVHYENFIIPSKNNNNYWYIQGHFDNGDSCTFWYPNDIISIQSAIHTLSDGSDFSFDARDYVKIILEDNIPHLTMIKDKVLLGENIGAVNDAEGRVYNNSDEIVNNMQPWTGAHVTYYGYVHEEEIREWAEEVEISDGNPQYLFYSGTAPSNPIIEFTFTPKFDSNSYISLPNNQYSDSNILNNKNYHYVAIDDNYFYFTTPSLLTGYNQAIYNVQNFPIGGAFSELVMLLKEQINEYHARAWAIFCAKNLEKNTDCVDSNSAVKTNFLSNFIDRMKLLFCSDGVTPNSIRCSFNSRNGTSIVEFSGIREADRNPQNKDGSSISIGEITAISQKKISENAGDMVKSDYLIINGRNYPNYNGEITKKECHVITTNFPSSNPLVGLLVTFKNMYY